MDPCDKHRGDDLLRLLRPYAIPPRTYAGVYCLWNILSSQPKAQIQGSNMIETIDMTEILTNVASICVIVGSLYGLWRFAKRNWNKPDEPSN